MLGAHAAIDLYWLPLGAGGHSVRFNGLVFEAILARRRRRARRELYHSALQVHVDGELYVIEMAPAWGHRDADRGVVARGPVGSRLLGRSVLFRYEIRCWRRGEIPDIAEAVGEPLRLSRDPLLARRVLTMAPAVPDLVWGRDEHQTGDMWNSNSIIAWILVRSGVDVTGVQPPDGGRAPGWTAGVIAAHAR
jgi:hypothetical protein